MTNEVKVNSGKSFFFFLLVIGQVVQAQISEYKIYHLTRNSGLSQSTVNCIIRDSIGFMWFGTNDGLNRYDGYSFTHYEHDPTDPTTISLGRVFSVFLDSKGRLWAGSDQGGLNLYNRNLDNFSRFSFTRASGDESAVNDVRAIEETANGYLWVATNGLGLWLFNTETKQFSEFLTEGIDVVNDIQYDFAGNLWLAADNGLYVIEKGTRGPESGSVRAVETLAGINMLSLYLNKDGKLWIGTYGSGAYSYDLISNEISHYATSEKGYRQLSHDIVRCITRDLDDKIIIGTGGGGINLVDEEAKHIEYLQHRLNYVNSLNTNILYTFYRDPNQNLWMGTYNGGVNVVFRHKDKFGHLKSYGEPGDLSNNAVLDMEEASDGRLWVGTDGGGLNLYEPSTGTFRHFLHDPGNSRSISGDVVKSLKVDSRGIHWIGTFTAGLTAFDSRHGSFTRYYHDPDDPNSLSGNHIWDIEEDTLGNIWLAILGGGLNYYIRDQKIFRHFTHDPDTEGSLSDDDISCLLCDSKGRLWVGTEFGGLNLLTDREKGRFISFIHDDEEPSSIGSDHISTVFEDSEGTIWVGTVGGGLSRFDESTGGFVQFTEEDGLANNLVYAILQDDEGHLWISTNDGMSRFTPPEGDRGKPVFRNFYMGDGLQSNEFSPQAACKTSTGVMYFGGINGINFFRPEEIDSNTYVPPIVLTDLKIFNKSVPVGGPEGLLKRHISQTQELKLSYRQSVITFEYAALDYTMPSQNKYKYKLEGFETEWNDVGNRRTATYTNLDPGKDYVFRVIGSNNDEVWNREGYSLKLIITPPFRKTWLFRVLLAATILLIFFSAYRYKVSALDNQRRMLRQMVDERTYELLDLNKILEQQNKEIKYHREELMNQKENLLMANKELEEKQFQIKEQNLELEKHRNHLEELVRQRTAELEEAKQKAEESDRLKTSFLSNMSHEIRTPMNAIVGFASLLGDGDLTDEEKGDYVKQIRTNSETLLVLINDILDLSKIESNQLRVDKVRVHLSEFIDELFKTFVFRDKPGVSLELEKNFPADLQIVSDPTRLRQILVNLLDNAIKFTEKGYVRLHVIGHRSLVSFIVEDSGIGMSQEVRTRIFERFFKSEDASGKLYRGTGLGLTITQKLVEFLGGTISVESETGKGSRFKIDLPVSEK